MNPYSVASWAMRPSVQVVKPKAMTRAASFYAESIAFEGASLSETGRVPGLM